MAEKAKSVLLNPQHYTAQHVDEKTHQAMLDILAFFENKGLAAMREDAENKKWQADFMEFQKEHKIYATMLTQEGYGEDGSRYDLARICETSELLGFYGIGYQYPFQVSVLGTGPVWMGDNEEQKKEMAQQLLDGHIFAFGMSEKQHGADLYSNEATITPKGDGTYVANGNKYYIGNAQIASKVTTLGKNDKTGEWVYWVVDSRHRNYKYVGDIDTPIFRVARVGEYEMIEYPITDGDILKVGDGAFGDGLSSVNIGKFQLGFASSAIMTHCLYEAVTHANRRMIYGKPVTMFPHIRQFLCESFVRINAMRLYALRSLDYFRSMSADDRRYLLFNPIQKMKVTTQAGEVMRLIMDVVCAKGFENQNFISDAFTSVDSIYRLEGTAHVNMALVLKFMKNYFFSNVQYPEIGIRNDAKDDANVFKQTTGGLAKVQFPDYHKAYEGVSTPNVKVFQAIIEQFKDMISTAAPDESLLKNMDYMLNIGEMFTMVVYAQLVLEGAKLHNVDDMLIDQIFGAFVKDMNKFALNQLNSQQNTPAQVEYLKKMILTNPIVDKEKDFAFWTDYVQVLDGAYVQKDAPIGND
ncbi:MAG: acyl-CoA dehydrogenase family protein [Oscillibacter sp.]